MHDYGGLLQVTVRESHGHLRRFERPGRKEYHRNHYHRRHLSVPLLTKPMLIAGQMRSVR